MVVSGALIHADCFGQMVLCVSACLVDAKPTSTISTKIMSIYKL